MCTVTPDACATLFTLASFVMAPIWKQYPWPLRVRWINEVQGGHTKEYYATMQRDGLELHSNLDNSHDVGENKKTEEYTVLVHPQIFNLKSRQKKTILSDH